MPFPHISHPDAKPPSFELRVTEYELMMQMDIQQHIQDRLSEAHAKVQLPELPPGYSWGVKVEALTNPQDNDYTIRTIYKARRDDGYEEATGQGDLEVRGDQPRLTGRVPDSRGLEGHREASQDPAGDSNPSHRYSPGYADSDDSTA